MPKYGGWFLYYDYEDHVEPTLLWFHCKWTKDPNVHLFDDDIDCPKRVKFSNLPVECTGQYSTEQNPILPADPLDSITFEILNRQTPQFKQNDSQSFHTRFYGPGEGPSKISPRFHPHEDEDIDTTLPWRMPVEDDAQIESTSEASH